MRTIQTETKHNPYSIYIESGLLNQLPSFLEPLGVQKKLAVITDDTVNKLYADKLTQHLLNCGRNVCKFVFPHGEPSKNLDTVQEAYHFLSENAITRSDMILAVGGGVVGDLAGFVAATWLRGIPFVQIPTTFLAMVDSSVGGKTGVDLPEGKNLVGAFWQPALVICDPSTLKTLPDSTFSDGIAEAIKCGAILDKNLFQLLAEGSLQEHLEEIIYRCIDLKRTIVESDERDKGIRQLLNFGHTFAHAIEKQSQYATSHGHAVAIGMVLMANACERQTITPSGTAERIEACCKRYGLPVTTDFDLDALCVHCMGDKKRAGDKLTLVVLEQLGKGILYPITAHTLPSFMKGSTL